jgi:hypothetical protein
MRPAAWLAVLCPVLVACGTAGPEDGRLRELASNQARWDALHPDAYLYAVERLCFCPEEYRGPVRVRVEHGVAADRVYVASGLAVPPGIAPAFPTVDGIFELLRSAIEADAFEVRVTYDQALGVPIDVWIDYNEMTADEELGMRVTEAVAPAP